MIGKKKQIPELVCFSPQLGIQKGNAGNHRIGHNRVIELEGNFEISL